MFLTSLLIVVTVILQIALQLVRQGITAKNETKVVETGDLKDTVSSDPNNPSVGETQQGVTSSSSSESSDSIGITAGSLDADTTSGSVSDQALQSTDQHIEPKVFSDF